MVNLSEIEHLQSFLNLFSISSYIYESSLFLGMGKEKMKRQIFSLVVPSMLAMMLTLTLSTLVFAQGGGNIRLEPCSSYYPLPIMLSSPATFNVSTESPQQVAYDPQIFLVMTNASYQGLTGNVTVAWDGETIKFTKANFTIANESQGAKIPPLPGLPVYTVSSLKEHIGVNGTEDDTLYYAYGPFLSKPVNSTKQEFTVELPSTNPRMLVYVVGKSSPSKENYDMFVPPTQPGIVVPDLAPIFLAMSSFAAFGIYWYRSKRLNL